MGLFDEIGGRELLPLRGRQVSGELAIRETCKRHKHFVAQAPTGYGKTQQSAHIIDGCLRKGKRALFIAPAIQLVEQTRESFERQGITDVGIMQAQHVRTNRHAALQIACLATLVRRPPPPVDLVLVDECHQQSEFLYGLMNTIWKDTIVIGLSATPWARGMGLHYTTLLVLATMKQMIEDGAPTGLCKWWGYGVPPKFAPNVSGVHRVAGELRDGELSGVMSAKSIVGNTVETWLKHRQNGNHPGNRTFLYGHNRAHAKELMEAFNAQGVPFGYIDGETNADDRRKVFEKYDSLEIAGVANVGVLIAGVDKDVRCISDNRYSESETYLVQSHGRGMRLKTDGDVLFVLDHAGNRDRMGNPEDIHHANLDKRSPGDKSEPFEGERPTPKPRTCGKCSALIPPATKACPLCGDVFSKPNTIEHEKGELVEFGLTPPKAKKSKKEEPTPAMKEVFYAEAIHIADEKGRKRGWADHLYFERYKHWPTRKNGIEPIAPSYETLRYVQSRNIARAKSRQNETVETGERRVGNG